MTIKWDAEHPDSNTCAEQWHYNVDFRLNNDRCSSDDFLNRDDGSIDMIVYKVEGPRSNLGGISSISSMGNPKDFEWLRNRTKPTARQISISKSLTESMVKQNLCWTGHFIPPPPTENASNTLSFERVLGVEGVLVAPRARAPKWLQFWDLFGARTRARGAPRTPFTLRNFSREIFFSIKWPVQVKTLKNTFLPGMATLYPLPPIENASLKWPVQVKPLKKHIFTWNGHFIPYTPSPNRECLYKVASPSKTLEKTESMLDWPLYTPSPNRECLYKVASPGKTPEKNTFLPGMATLYPSQWAPGLWPGNGRTDNKVKGENYNGEVQREGYHKKMRHVTFIYVYCFQCVI